MELTEFECFGGIFRLYFADSTIHLMHLVLDEIGSIRYFPAAFRT